MFASKPLRMRRPVWFVDASIPCHLLELGLSNLGSLQPGFTLKNYIVLHTNLFWKPGSFRRRALYFICTTQWRC